jgi:hypothetical protein
MGGKDNALADSAASRVDENDLAGLSRNGQELFVGGQGEGQGAQAGERNLNASGRQNLIYGQDGSVRPARSDRLPIGLSLFLDPAGRAEGDDQREGCGKHC